MAYTPINWQTGDTITAEKLNKMDNGWSVENTQLFSETVTTVAGEMGNSAQLSYTGTETPATLNITFNGTDYVCPLDGLGYGSMDFSTYPFLLLSMDGMWTLDTETAGEQTISASVVQLEVSNNFRTAVDECVDTSTMPMLCVSGATTYVEMAKAADAGRILFFKPFQNNNQVRYITSFAQSNVSFIPETGSVTASFTDGVFTVSIT